MSVWLTSHSLKGRSFSFKCRIAYMCQLRSCHSCSPSYYKIILLYANAALINILRMQETEAFLVVAQMKRELL